MSISPLQLPNITSAAVFVLSSVDHLNKQNFTAIKTDSKQNIRVSAKWIVLYKTISAYSLFFSLLRCVSWKKYFMQQTWQQLS